MPRLSRLFGLLGIAALAAVALVVAPHFAKPVHACATREVSHYQPGGTQFNDGDPNAPINGVAVRITIYTDGCNSYKAINVTTFDHASGNEAGDNGSPAHSDAGTVESYVRIKGFGASCTGVSTYVHVTSNAEYVTTATADTGWIAFTPSCITQNQLHADNSAYSGAVYEGTDSGSGDHDSESNEQTESGWGFVYISATL